MNEFNECVHEVFSAAGDIIIKSMMGGYLVLLGRSKPFGGYSRMAGN